jgi:hypothetical protein
MARISRRTIKMDGKRRMKVIKKDKRENKAGEKREKEKK